MSQHCSSSPPPCLPALLFPVRCALLALSLAMATAPARPAGLSPDEAVRVFKVAQGFRAKVFAGEPDIRQPVSMYFDERGRMWVVQYLQYPNPAGLTAVKVDQYLRTAYDRFPEPPPKGPKGADKITICEDVDGDGRADRFRDFVTGLNLATGVAVGHGGVFVLQSPYLLFYPDRDRDDRPDGDPEVLLTGFGMEDSHAFANSLQWGPDGWLYGAQGSTVTARIRGIEFQQGIWRYHPLTKAFELFSEGGGNTWGLDFDRQGNVIAGTNFGGEIALHQTQGAYHLKNFGKHGELHNPHAYGYFGHIPYTGFQGGHVTCGGIVYQGGSFPESFRGQYIAANLLANTVYWHHLETHGSSFKGRFGGVLLASPDAWFRPVDCALGPDGSVFIADWYDQRATHVDPQDNWDRSNGRIYKLEADATKPVAAFDLAQQPSQELVALLQHPNGWFSREARRILAERRDASVLPALRKNIFERAAHPVALESLWALYVSGGFSAELAHQLLEHPDESIRTWTIRLLGDEQHVPASLQSRFLQLAKTDPSPVVRSQLACTSKRLPGKEGLPIAQALLQRSEDASDIHLPLLLWWSLESKCVSHRPQVLALFREPGFWRAPIVQQTILERIARRYAAEGTEADFEACRTLLDLAPGPDQTDRLLEGMEKALQGRRLDVIPEELAQALDRLWQRVEPSMRLIRFSLRLGHGKARDHALRLVQNSSAPETDRTGLITILGETQEKAAMPALLELVESTESKALKTAALQALERFPDAQIAPRVLGAYGRLPADLKTRARALLFSRSEWARAFIDRVERGDIPPSEVPFDQLRQVTLHRDAGLDQLVEKHWGKIRSETEGIKRARVGGIASILAQAKGHPGRGRELFQKHCGICHGLFGEGNNIGPDLTGADRKNRDLMLTSIIDPSAVIRREYVAYEVHTKDGRVLSGLMADSTPQTLTLLDQNNQRTVLARTDVQETRESTLSLMPEGLLDSLGPQEIRDLIAYLQSDGPGPAQPASP